MELLAFPPAQGVTKGELEKLFSTGFQFVGLLPIVDSRAIATPSNPSAGLPRPVLLFARPEPALPASQVIQLLMSIHLGKITARQALDNLKVGGV